MSKLMPEEPTEKKVILKLVDVYKIYVMGDTKLYALNDVNMEIYDGEFLVISGPSGSGKSTAMNIIGATDRPTKGHVYFLDEDLTTASDKELTLYRRNDVGFVFQFYNLLPTLTALENVEVATEIAKNPMDPMEALDMVGLKDYAHHFPAQMSGGQQQRVSMARAIAGNPRLLLCDEPTGALDSEMSEQVMKLLIKICKQLKKTVVMITHDDELAKIGDRIIDIKDGKIEKVLVQKNPMRFDSDQ